MSKMPFYLQEEWIKIITQVGQDLCRENYSDYTIHESDVTVTLKSLWIVLQAIKKVKKEQELMKVTELELKTPPATRRRHKR